MDITNKTNIEFILKEKDKKEILEINIDNELFMIDFTNEDQSMLRKLFLVVLKKMKKDNKLIEFVYVKDDNFDNTLFESVASDYIAGLNRELVSIFNDMQEIK